MSTNAAPRRRGLSTNAKVGIAVAALVALVFVVTMVSQLSPPPAPNKGGGPDGPADDGPPKQGLEPRGQGLEYLPSGRRAAEREYQQFFERGDTFVPFWVSNRQPVPLTLTFTKTSCGACSFAEVAVVPAPAIDGSADPDPFGAVCGGVLGKSPVLRDDPEPFGLDLLEHAERKRRVEAIPADAWKRIKAANSTRENVTGAVPNVTIPAAVGGKPTWAVVRLNIGVTESKVLETSFHVTRPDSPLSFPLDLGASVTLVEPCAVAPAVIDFGTVAEGTDKLEQEVFFYSAIRSTAPDAPLKLSPPVKPDLRRQPHVTLSDPVPATADELKRLAARLTAERKAPQRVAGAYKQTLTFTRAAADKTADAPLGPSERVVSFAPDGGVLPTKTPEIKLKTDLLGPVALEGGGQIDLKTYYIRDGLDRDFRLGSDQADLELEWVKEETTPAFLVVGKPEKATKGGRTLWTFPLTIAPNAGSDVPPGSVVVLRIKGTGQRVRIPVAGSGKS